VAAKSEDLGISLEYVIRGILEASKGTHFKEVVLFEG
jgi:hypothetical protein